MFLCVDYLTNTYLPIYLDVDYLTRTYLPIYLGVRPQGGAGQGQVLVLPGLLPREELAPCQDYSRFVFLIYLLPHSVQPSLLKSQVLYACSFFKAQASLFTFATLPHTPHMMNYIFLV